MRPGDRTLHVRPPPQPNVLDQREYRSAVVGERVLDSCWNRARRRAVDDPVAHELAKLLREDFLRDAWNGLPEACEVFRRLRQPVDNDQLPLTANCRQRGCQRTPAHRVGSPGPLMVTSRCLLDGPHGSYYGSS